MNSFGFATVSNKKPKFDKTTIKETIKMKIKTTVQVIKVE